MPEVTGGIADAILGIPDAVTGPRQDGLMGVDIIDGELFFHGHDEFDQV